jgi:FG-GAP-like repeat/Domain of unknown function (DUF4214)/FG-GAP repeat
MQWSDGLEMNEAFRNRPTLFLEPLEDRKLLAISFAPPVTFPVANPSFVAVGDLNHDGDLDIVAVDNSTAVNVLLGNGHGRFTTAPGSPLASGDFPEAVAIGDFNGDGNPDLAVACFTLPPTSGTLRVLLGNGDGTFRAGKNFTIGVDPANIVTGDFTGNGKLDLAVAEGTALVPGGPPGVSVLLGNGDGTFQNAIGYPTPAAPYNVAVGDFTGDGKLDLVTANPFFPGAPSTQGGGNVSVFLNRGDGTFAPAENIPVPDNPIYVAVGDFTGNGRVDLITANSDNTVSILLGNGDGTFQAPRTFPAGVTAAMVAVGDFTNNGRLDAVVGNGGSNTISLLLGNGDGTLQAPLTFPTGGLYAEPLAVGDFTNDGRLDVAVANFLTNTVSLLFNQGIVSAGQAWLDRVYHDLLNRPVDPVGQSAWLGLLNQGVSRQIIVAMIEHSVEYRTDEVEKLYEQLLNRNADPQGLNGFVNALGSGATILQIEAAIAGSPEFFQDAGGTDEDFVDALYEDLLHRAPDPGGQGAALTALSDGVSRQAVAAALLSSEEFYADLVTSLYIELLQRAPDPFGFNLSMQALGNGFSEEGLVAVLAGSNEYFASSTD